MGGGSDLQRLSGGENVALGCITGVMAKACNYPFLVWKNAAQQGLPMVLNPLLVYRGLPMACLNLGGTNAVQFGATGVFQKWMASSGFVQDQVQVGGAFLGGAASGLPCSLWELCMIQQQRFGGSIGSTMSRLVSEHGAGVLGRRVGAERLGGRRRHHAVRRGARAARAGPGKPPQRAQRPHRGSGAQLPTAGWSRGSGARFRQLPDGSLDCNLAARHTSR